MHSLRTDVAVLGAGLQGTSIALELARRGIEVTLVERDPLALNRASLRNEGKIHLGLIYANEPSRATAFLQLHGALAFRSLLARWIDVDRGICTRARWSTPPGNRARLWMRPWASRLRLGSSIVSSTGSSPDFRSISAKRRPSPWCWAVTATWLSGPTGPRTSPGIPTSCADGATASRLR